MFIVASIKSIVLNSGVSYYLIQKGLLKYLFTDKESSASCYSCWKFVGFFFFYIWKEVLERIPPGKKQYLSYLAFPSSWSLCALFIHVQMYGLLLLADAFNASHGQEI